jgi:alkaline phosphatase
MKILLALLLAAPLMAQQAKNVILFLGDAAGLPTIHAASIVHHGKPAALFIQRMPHIGLMETSAAARWVTDSAAGMTAIVTGVKTHNGVVAQSADAVRGKKDGVALRTILEYAEERGLSTGVISNSPITSATPAALYAHVNDRKNDEEIFEQMLKARYGDGVDVVIGPARPDMRQTIMERLSASKYAVHEQVPAAPPDGARLAVITKRKTLTCRLLRRWPSGCSPATRKATFSWWSRTAIPSGSATDSIASSPSTAPSSAPPRSQGQTR